MAENTRTNKQETRRVITDYEAAYPDPLVIRTGERLTVSDRETEWEGWLWCTNQQGQSGWVPAGNLAPVDQALHAPED